MWPAFHKTCFTLSGTFWCRDSLFHSGASWNLIVICMTTKRIILMWKAPNRIPKIQSLPPAEPRVAWISVSDKNGHAYHVMSHVWYNCWHEDSALISINKWMTVVYEIFSIRMIENFVIKLEALSSCTRNQILVILKCC